MEQTLHFKISDKQGATADRVVNKAQLLRIANTMRKTFNLTSYDSETTYAEVKTLAQAYSILDLDNYEVATV